MNVSFHPEAEEEFIKAIAYYEDCDPGLGLDFSREINACAQNATAFPTLWPEIDVEVRRCLARRFPYGVLYCIESNDIFILAIMHLHRDPDYWKDRLGSS